jgi:hypothetical protein
MTKYILKIVGISQRGLLVLSYWFFRCCIRRKKNSISWVVGVSEIAATTKYTSLSIPDSYSVCLLGNKYYDFEYSFSIKMSKYRYLDILKMIVIGPLLLGFLLNRSNNFLYIGQHGFLLYVMDGRKFEFMYVKNKNKNIVCLFTGSDIRSPRLMLDYAQKNKIDVISTYQHLTDPRLLTSEHEATVKKLAEVAETYADLVFNSSVDQMSYFTKKTQPSVGYFYPDENFITNDTKFANIKTYKICHAPTTPIIKGTQLVRAAIAKLRAEGYRFEYVELTGVSNEVVLKELKSTHIVLNQFYAFVPGVFGVEAMASHCALITSADEHIETDLPPGSNKAWYVTKYYEIYDHLKTLLNSPDLIKKYADAGYEWAIENASFSRSSVKLMSLLNRIEKHL